MSGAPAVTGSQIDPVEAAIWETLEAADAAGALDALNLGEIRLWLDGPTAPEGRIGGPRRALALDMNRIALHAESPGHEPEAPDAWSRLSEITVPVLVVVGDLDLRHVQERGREAGRAHQRRHPARDAGRRPPPGVRATRGLRRTSCARSWGRTRTDHRARPSRGGPHVGASRGSVAVTASGLIRRCADVGLLPTAAGPIGELNRPSGSRRSRSTP